MAMAMMRSGFQAALRRGARTAPSKRGFASSAQHEDAHEAAKWEKITYVGIVSCTILAIVNLSKGHQHTEEPPVPYGDPPRFTGWDVEAGSTLKFWVLRKDFVQAYSYLHIRNKEFPWGPDGLFEVKEHH